MGIVPVLYLFDVPLGLEAMSNIPLLFVTSFHDLSQRDPCRLDFKLMERTRQDYLSNALQLGRAVSVSKRVFSTTLYLAKRPFFVGQVKFRRPNASKIPSCMVRLLIWACPPRVSL